MYTVVFKIDGVNRIRNMTGIIYIKEKDKTNKLEKTDGQYTRQILST